MRLVSFEYEGNTSYGAVKGDQIVDLGLLMGDKAIDLKSLIAEGLLSEAQRLLAEHAGTVALAQARLLPVIPNPDKIVCVGLNYLEHVHEVNREVTESPTLFLRTNDSQVGHNEPLVLPPESDAFDYEGEIAIVIGREGRRIAAADAWDYVAGYACYNDGSIRDWQWHTTQWTAGKNFWHTASFGPWLVTSDEIKPEQKMTLITRLNGEEMQKATTDMMMHTIPAQIAYISQFMPLKPGDVIVTGTPGGVGARREPPVYMKDGDVVEIEVDAIGVLRNTVVAERI